MMNQIQPMLREFTTLWNGLKTSTWPKSFFTVTLSLPEKITDSLQLYAKIFMVFYFVMAALSLLLHFGKKQKSFSSFRRKLTDFVLTVLMPVLIRLIVFIFQVGLELASEVEGSFSLSLAGIDWVGKIITAWFFPAGLCLIFLVIATMPLYTVKRYLREYRFAGIPWAVFDVFFGFLFLSAAVCAMSTGNPLWYVSVAAAAVLVALGQTGGVETD